VNNKRKNADHQKLPVHSYNAFVNPLIKLNFIKKIKIEVPCKSKKKRCEGLLINLEFGGGVFLNR
jgi:hypothetical protein